MATKTISIALGEPFVAFLDDLVASGRYESASAAVRAGLQLLAAQEDRLVKLKAAIADGEASPVVPYSLEGVLDKVIAKS